MQETNTDKNKLLGILRFGLLLAFTVFFHNFSFGNSSISIECNQKFSRDSLIIEKTGGGKQVVINKDELIKVWLSDKSTIKGQFTAFHKDSLQIQTEHGEERIHSKDVAKIKLYSGKTGRIIGTVIMVASAASIASSGAGIFLALALISSDIILIPLITYMVINGGLSFGFLKIGELIVGRTYNLKFRWAIVR